MSGWRIFYLLLLYWGLCWGSLNPLMAQEPKVSLSFQETPVTVVLQALADYQQINLVTTPAVSGNLSLHLVDVSWTQALAVITEMAELQFRRQGDILLISPALPAPPLPKPAPVLQRFEQQLKQADVNQVADNLKAERASLLSEHGRWLVDTGRNTLVVHDIASQLVHLKPWLVSQDIALPQIQLAAHIVTIGSDSLRELGVFWGLSEPSLRINNFSVGIPLGAPGLTAGFRLGRLNGRLLDLELRALEQESEVQIIASPRLVTSHQQTASIKQGSEIPYEVARGNNGATSIEFKEAVLGMEVTPTLRANGKITLSLQISQNTPGKALKRSNGEVLAIDKQEITTQITLRDGETLVLGGIFQQQTLQSADKVPILGDMPVIGGLFRQTNQQQKRRELVIFITPTLINE